LPLKRWVYIAATYEAHEGLAIYIDGKEAGRLPVQGEINEAAGVDLLIGRVRRPALPVPAGAIHPMYPVWYSLDGILDELKIYETSQSSEQVLQAYDAVKPPERDVLPGRKCPQARPEQGDLERTIAH
jgi:Concanavalin A-like lectin/glucanases superfamily